MGRFNTPFYHVYLLRVSRRVASGFCQENIIIIECSKNSQDILCIVRPGTFAYNTHFCIVRGLHMYAVENAGVYVHVLLFLMLSLVAVSQILTTYHLLAVTTCFHSLQTVCVSVHHICVCRVFTYRERESCIVTSILYSCRFWLHHLLCLCTCAVSYGRGTLIYT